MQWNPVMAWLVRSVGSFHAAVFRAFGGRGIVARNILLLTTRGRKSGREITNPLLYVERDGRLYIVASFGGSDTPPGWYKNLLAHSDVQVERAGDRRLYRARSLDATEAAPIWPLLLAIYPAYADYQKRTTRVIPIVELIPATA